jgi:hypothetical protein
MDMKNVEAMGLPHFRHLHRERQRVIGTRKDGGVTDGDLMKMNPRQGEIEPDWFGVAEEMNLVPTRRQLSAKRGRQNPASSDQRKTDYSDLERRQRTRRAHGSRRVTLYSLRMQDATHPQRITGGRPTFSGPCH